MRKATAAIAALWLWCLLLLLTHAAARSPYSYGWAIFGKPAMRVLGAVVNPDAMGMVPVARYFYDAQPPVTWRGAPNFRLPLHGFVVSVLMPFTRSTLLANYAANLGALMLLSVVAIRLCERYRLPLLPSTVALMTFLALPWVVTYIGQPMHYIVATTINFLAVIAAFALDDDDLRRPLVAGLLVAVILLNYDPYIYAIALTVWVARFRRVRDYAVFVAVAVLPIVAWTAYVRYASDDTLSRQTERSFIKPVVDAWTEFLRHPLQHAAQPFLAGHIGLHIGTHLILAEVWWPLLLICAAALWRLGDRIPRGRRTALLALLVVVYAVHQFGTAAFDWENNPRRALPVVLAAGIAYCWCAAELWPRRGWRIAFAAVLAVCIFLTMADALFDMPVMTFFSTGQAINFHPRYAMQLRWMTMESMPALMHDQDMNWHDLGRVSPLARFFPPQLFLLFFCCALLWTLSRARLLPRHAAVAGALLWLASLVRFL